jgi:serine/threonine protein phosphatase PrpC
VTPNEAMRIASGTDPGMVREHNEDSIGTWAELGLVVLADGMGGYNAGEVASGMATSSVAAGIAQTWTAEELGKLNRADAISLSQVLLAEQVRNTNAAIYAAAESNPECEGMGTTLVACLFHLDFVTVAHVGDSRLYCLRDGSLRQVTDDHSLLQEQIAAGLLTKETAHLSNNKNFVTRAVGVAPEEEAEIHTYEMQSGDLYLLCSDGLHGMVSDEDIQMTLLALGANLDLAARQLIQAANDAGGRDNVSVILVRIGDAPVAAAAGGADPDFDELTWD